jgi:hypothetical protein
MKKINCSELLFFDLNLTYIYPTENVLIRTAPVQNRTLLSFFHHDLFYDIIQIIRNLSNVA